MAEIALQTETVEELVLFPDIRSPRSRDLVAIEREELGMKQGKADNGGGRALHKIRGLFQKVAGLRMVPPQELLHDHPFSPFELEVFEGEQSVNGGYMKRR